MLLVFLSQHLISIVLCVPGVMSAIIMLPANILLVTIFKNCRPRYPRHLYHVHLDTLRMHLSEQAIKGTRSVTSVQKGQSSVKRSDDEYMAKERANSVVSLRRRGSTSTRAGEDPEAKDPVLEQVASEFRHKYTKCTYFLPWWCLYIAWVSYSVI